MEKQVLCALALLAGCTRPAAPKLDSSAQNDAIQRGYGAINRGVPDEAVRLFGDVLRANPENAEANFGLAWAEQNKSELAAAIVHYRKAIALAAASGAMDTEYFSHFNLGTLYQKSNQPEAAVSEFFHATRLRDDAWQAWYNLGTTWALLGASARAQTAIARAAALNPRLVPAPQPAPAPVAPRKK